MQDSNKKEQLAAAINDAYVDFIKTLNSVSDEKLNVVPFEGSWTAGQVADHILKATGGIPDNKTKPAERPFDAFVPGLESAFLNFDVKMKSPEFILPGNGPFSKSSLSETLNALRKLHVETIENEDLTAICLDFELPFTGHLTRYEWFRFFVAHCRRHTNQLQRIVNALQQY